MTDWKREAEVLRIQLEDARATNRVLHRRVQGTEGPLQGQIQFLEWKVEYYKSMFTRAMRREAELRKIATAPRPENWLARLSRRMK